MAGKIYLPHPEIVCKWKEEKVIRWLKRVHLDDCIPAFKIRHVDGQKLLELDEQKLFTTYQDLKIKQKKQIAKCVQECKSQAENAKRIAKTIKKKQRLQQNSIDNNVTYSSDDDFDDWGSDFEDESEDELNDDSQVPELNNNTIVQPPCITSEKNSNLNSSQEKPSVIPQPPDVPVISNIVNGNGTTGRKTSNTNSIPRPPIKRPPSQPPPPPVVKQPPSQDFEQEDYEIPIVSTSTSLKEITDILDSSLQSIASSGFASETYELIEPPEETYEMVDAPSSTANNIEKPALPPRIPSSGSISPPPPLPQKPKKFLNDRHDGVKTFTRPKPPPPKPESEPEMSQSSVPNIGFLGTLMGRRPSNTGSPKSEPKSKDFPDGSLSSNHSIVSSSDGLSSRSSSPDKDGSSASNDSKKSSSLSALCSRATQSTSDETAQNMATRPLPPVPILAPEEKKIINKEDFSSYPWYHEIERQMAEEVVRNLKESGSFVVRPSKRAGVENPYSVTILHDEKLFHLNIRIRPDNTYALGKEKKVEKTFSTVADLIAFHQTDPILLTSRGEPAGKTILSKYPEKS